MKIVSGPEPTDLDETYTVVMTKRELLTILAVAGHVGGSPHYFKEGPNNAPRAVFERLGDVVASKFYPTGYKQAPRVLGIVVDGHLKLNPIRESE